MNPTPTHRPTAGVYLLLTLAVAATTAVAAVAFYGSFRAMADWSVRVGLTTPHTAWTFPLSIDGAVVVSSLLVVACALMKMPTRYPNLAFLVSLGTSVAVNVAHAPPRLDAQLGAAVFPVALAICAHLVFTVFQAVLDRKASGPVRARSGYATRLMEATVRRYEHGPVVGRHEAAPADRAAATRAEPQPDRTPARTVPLNLPTSPSVLNGDRTPPVRDRGRLWDAVLAAKQADPTLSQGGAAAAVFDVSRPADVAAADMSAVKRVIASHRTEWENAST